MYDAPKLEKGYFLCARKERGAIFGCLGDSAWNCIPTVYSVVMRSSIFF